ncbi:hypothetical protein Mapa_006847 [Marchantia paleacea]|nr:hypothetical protein Mapa_006847 [Marchantia paleacea]
MVAKTILHMLHKSRTSEAFEERIWVFSVDLAKEAWWWQRRQICSSHIPQTQSQRQGTSKSP